jgi:hypothetical protein
MLALKVETSSRENSPQDEHIDHPG